MRKYLYIVVCLFLAVNVFAKSGHPGVTDVTYDGITPSLDSATNATNIIDYEHHEIHAGSHYFYEDYVTLSDGADRVFAIQTANTTKWSHIVWEVQAQGIITFEIYEGASVTFDGTDITAYNNDRNSGNTSNWVNFEYDPTVASSGTLLGQTSVGGATNPVNGVPGGGKRNREIILKQNTTQLIYLS